jgi:Glycosyltransferase family 87
VAGYSGVMPALANAVARLRAGNWPDRGFIRAAAAALPAIELAVSAFMVAGTHGWIVPLAQPTGTDFVSFYAAGALANRGTPELVYNLAEHAAAEEAATGPGVPYQFFNYPPVFLLLCGPLARLPYLAAFAVFEAATLALYLLVARRILGDPGGTALLALVAFPLVFWTVGLGQNSFLTAALFGGATLLVDRRPIVAGLLFGALCYKPHYGLLVPFALAAGRCWSALAAAAVSVGALALVSLAAFAVLAAATPIAVPVSLYQDLMLDAIAGAWLIRECASSRTAGWEKTRWPASTSRHYTLGTWPSTGPCRCSRSPRQPWSRLLPCGPGESGRCSCRGWALSNSPGRWRRGPAAATIDWMACPGFLDGFSRP